MATEIRVPVKLEVLQNSIAQIKSTLSSLRPESGAWKELQNILRSMTREADSLQSAMSKPFSSQHQFAAAEKGVDKIEDALERARIAMGRIKFSDIQLDAGQLASVKEFEKQLQDIQNKAKNFKATLKAELQGSEQWADFLKIDPDAAIHSYDEIVKAVTARVKQIEDESKKAAEALRVATDESTRAEATNKFFTAKKALSKESMGTDWDKFFSIDKNGATRFKSGQKSAFYDWMRDNLTITPEQYEEIKSKTITELQKWIQDFDISAIIKDAENKRSAKSDASARVAQLVADSKKIESLQATLTANQTRLAPNNQQLAAETARVTAEYNAFKTSAENGARAALSSGAAMQQVSAECQTLYNALQRANSAWMQTDRAASTLNGMRQAVVNFMGFNQVLNITRQAVREAANHIKELDTVMSRIAIVTDMSTGDLWNQIDTYSNMAQSYGVSIKGAYEVSQIYYQQGLETADVMTLTNETLKLAKISGLDYATTTDYMTTAIRGFKMEMQDAATVVDVYSALAANTAVSQEELAVAMSKTASSMQGVGATFEEASAMIGTMVAVTRESATNIGSAMKSIASRYGELTKDPMTLIDSEGETLAFNKVDTALQSVGISMRTADGQFRNFTDVILELSDAWDSLDSTQQRYIATQFAGNRQQSRFLALVSNGEMLRQNIEVAESSEDTGTVQALKALDSIESKTEQVKVAYQQFYTTIGAENIWKAGLDGLTNYINMLNTLPKVFGKIPVGALAMIANLVEIIRGLGDSIIEHIASIWQRILPTDGFTKQSSQMQQDATEAGSNVAAGYTQGMQQGEGQAQSAGEKLGQTGIEGLKNGAGTHSPSVPATEAGTNVGAGYAQGMESAINLVYEAGQKLGTAGIQGLQDKLQELSSGSLTDQIAGISKILDTDGAALSSESKAFLQEQLAIAQQRLNQSGEKSGKVEIADQTASSNAIEVSTSKIQDQINALQELKALRQEINGLEKGSVEYQEKQELFTKKSVDFNKQLVNENVKQLSWNTGADKIQERIDILQKPLKATVGPATSQGSVTKPEELPVPIQPVIQDPIQASENFPPIPIKVIPEIAWEEYQNQQQESAYEAYIEQYSTMGSQIPQQINLSPQQINLPPSEPEPQNQEYYESLQLNQLYEDFSGNFTMQAQACQTLRYEIAQTVEELVRLGSMGERAGEDIKKGLQQASPEELNQKLEELKSKLADARTQQGWHRIDQIDTEAQAMAAKEAAVAEEKHGAAIQKVIGYMREKTDEGDAFGRKLSMIGSAIATITSLIDKSTEGGRAFAGAMTMASGAVKVISGLMQKNPLMALATGIVTIVNGISMMIEDDTERAERLAKEAEEASNKAKIAKADQRSVEKAIKDYDELKEKRYESEEDAEKYQAAVDDITSKFPSLIQGFNDTGEVILNAGEMERVLADARSKTAQATYEAAVAEQKKTEDELKAKQKSLKNDADMFTNAFKFVNNLVEGTTGQGSLIYSVLGYDSDSASYEDAPALFKNLAKAFNGLVGDYTSMDIAGSDNSLSAYLGGVMEAIQESVKENGESVLGEWGFNNTEDYYRFISHTAAGGGIFDFANWDATLDTTSPFLQNLNQIAQLYQAGEFNFENYAAKINQIKTAYDKLQGTLTSETLDEGAVQDAFNAYREALNSIEPYSPLYQLLGDARTYADSLGKNISEYGTLIAKDKAMSKQVASAWVSKQLGNKSIDGNLVSIIGNKLASIYNTDIINTTWQDAINNNAKDLRSTADTLIEQAQKFQANLDSDSNKKELFTKMTGNMGDYHWTDFKQAFDDIEGWKGISELIQEDYVKQASSIRELVQGKIKNAIDKRHEKKIFSGTVAAKLTRLSLDSNDFTISEQTVLSSILDGYNKLLDKDYFQEAESYITSMLPIFSQIQNITDTDTRNSAFKALKDNNLATSEGIIAAATDLDQIEGINGTIIENLTIIGNNMLTNIPLAIQSLTDAANTTWKETEKELDKLINGGIEGYEMTDLISRAHDLNVEIKDTDFTTTDSGRLLLAYDKWQDYYTVVTAQINNQISNLGTKLSNASQITSKDQLTRANLEEMGIFIESDEAANTDENWEKYQQAISKAASEYLLLQKIPTMMADNLESSQLKAGKFDSIIKSLTISEGEDAWDRLLQLAAGAELSASENQNKNITTTVKGIQGSINSLINDLLKKGKENIDLSDYEYIDKEKIDLSGRLQDIVIRYVKAAGLTIEEANNQIFAAIEKQNSTTDVDLIKDLTFKTGNLVELTEEQFKNLVNTFEIDITTENGAQLVNAFQASLNTLTGKAAMSLESLSDAGIDLQSVDNFTTVVNKSMATVFDNIGDSLTKGVELATKGTNKLADAQAFVESYNEVMNTSKTLEDLFSYNTALDTFVLNDTDLRLYLQQQVEQLGYTGTAIQEYIKSQTDLIIQNNIELDRLLKAETKQERNDEANKLIQQIRGLSNYRDIQLTAIMKSYDLKNTSLAIEELQHMTQEQIDLTILRTLESGGQVAVDLLKQIKPDASTDELEAVYNNAINKLRTAQEDLGKGIGETISGLAADIGEITGALEVVRLDDGTAVITAVHDMVSAYGTIYEQMKETAGHTIADLNNAYVQLLTAQDQKSVDLIEVLNNASGMTYEAIGQIFTRYGIELEQALLNSEDVGIARVGYNKIAITDFTKFKGYIEKAIGHTIEVGTQEYLDAYSAYVDSQINMRNQGKNNLQTAFDQLKSVTEAKIGDLLNVTYLEEAFDKSTKTDKNTLVQIAEKFGASIKDGILTISQYTDVPGLLQAIAEEAGRAGLLIPEQLAELTDAIADMLSNITSLISSGITGTLNNTDALSLQKWAEKQGLQSLEFNQTAEGLQLTADSIALVYTEMKRLDSLQAQSLLPTIIESNDRYSTLASTLQAAAEVIQRVNFVREQTIPNQRQVEAAYKKAQQLYKGDVPLDYNQRYHLLDNEGYIETHRAASASNETGITAVITPILPDGTDLGDDWAHDMAEKYANGEVKLETKLTGVNGEELDYSLKDVNMGLYETAEAAQAAADAEHEYSAAASEAAAASESLTSSLDSLTAQSSLMSDIVLNKLTDPDAMNFMSDKLPDNYQVAINAWENASKAINTLTAAGKNGYIGVEDFYNIVNTSAGLLEAAGKEFNIKGMNAAELMEAACQHLTVVDGDLKVDLSSAGMDMVSGVDDLKNNMTDGIHELADAEVAILDAEIQVLEVLAAMEKMGEMVVDVDNNGISFELNDMFTFDVNGNVDGFTDDMQAFLDQMQGAIKTSDELREAVYAIQINGTTLYDLFYGTAQEWEKTFGSAEAASKFMQKLSNIDWGTDINTIQTQIVNAMKDLGQNLVIDVGDNGLVGITATGQLFNIDLDDKDVAAQAQQAVDAFKADHPDFFEGTNLRDNVKQLINELNNPDSNYSQVDLQYTLKVVTGEIKIEEEKNEKGQKTDKFVGEYAGVQFRASSPVEVEKYIKQAIDLENQGLSGIKFNEEAGEVSGILSVGAARITVKKNDDETTFETDPPGFDGEGGVEGAVKWLAKQGYADNNLAGKTWSIDGTFYEVIQDNELGITYTFTRSSTGDSWLYNGQPFHSYDEMAQYIRDIVPLEQGLSDNWHAAPQNSSTDVKTKIWTNGTATIEYNVKTGETIIKADDITFKSRAEADEYLAQKAMAKQQEGSGGEITDNTSDGKTIKYTSNGNIYEVEYNSTGKVQTKVTMADTGYTFVAKNDTELAMGLATAAAIAKQKAGELPDLDGNQGTVIIHTDGGDYEVTIDDIGNITVTNSQGEVDEALSKVVTEKVNKSNIDIDLKNTIATAITEAFKSLSTQIDELDSEPLTEIATAISTIVTVIDNLSKSQGIETLNEELGKLDTETLEEVGIAFETISSNLQTLAANGNWAILTVALTLINALLTSLDEHSDVFETIATGVTNFPIDALNTIKNTLTEIADALADIDEKKQIQLDIQATEGLDSILTKLQQIAETLGQLAGSNFNLGNNGESGDSDNTYTANDVDISNANVIGEATGGKVNAEEVNVDEAQTDPIETKAKVNDIEMPEIPKTEVKIGTKVDESPIDSAIAKATTQYTMPVHMSVDSSEVDSWQPPNKTGTVTYTVSYSGGGKGGGKGGGGCFVAGTQISMANGTTKNIEDIVVGDLVVAYDYQYNQFVTGRINKAYVHHNTPNLMRVSFSDGRVITLTPGHPLLSTKGWKSRDLANSLYEHKTIATWLEVGDAIIGLNGISTVINIEDIEVPENYDTYNAEVATYHTFIANGLVAHNEKDERATGNVGLAKSKGTLMGELGPELVVSNGRYFVAGQNGAEMVDLADDAIVFNHLQTEQLLKKGMSNSRGKAVTSEKNAVAFATGNTGPAMASASAALAVLKQLRALWESLKSASVSDLAGAAGGGGGGGGGDNSKIVDPSIWIDTVERWYDLTQKIAKLEKEITHEETLRSKLQSDWNANGQHYYASQKRSLAALEEQLQVQEELNLSHEDYYKKRVEALKNQPFGKLIQFDDDGQMSFQPGAMEWLTDLMGFDSYGKANHTDEEKYNILMAAGFGDYMKYADGGEIKMDSDNDGEVTDEEMQQFYHDATQAVKDKLDSYQEATQSLNDEIKEGKDKYLELETQRNEILKEMRDNQMEVEQDVLDAMVDMREREIDALQEERDKLQESTEKYINGLSDALNKERQMYDNQEAENSLNQQKRRLAILQRSGGSAQDIANLRSEIDSAERDMYFNLQQQQIDAIQEASDLEIERMDHQIEIMTETLEYQKEYGLLWAGVYQVMMQSSDKITSFIMNGNSKFWELSPMAAEENYNDTLFAAEKWDEYRKDVDVMATESREKMRDRDYEVFDKSMRNLYGDDYDSDGRYRDLYYELYKKHGDPTEVEPAVSDQYKKDREAEEAARKAAEEEAARKAAEEAAAAAENNNASGDGGDGGGASSGSGDGEEVTIYYQTSSGDTRSVTGSSKKDAYSKVPGNALNASTNENQLKSGTTSTYDTTSNVQAGIEAGRRRVAAEAESSAGSSTTTTTTATKTITTTTTTTTEDKKKGRIAHNAKMHLASGGYANHGIYELGELGTETVLTASQTKVLRDNILSNRPNSLVSLLKSYNKGYDGINNSVNGVTPIEDNSTNIDKIELKMEVKQIANDYDARRAGEQALNEMMRIARKTGVTNGIRR